LLYQKQQDTLKRDITIFSQIHEIKFEYSLQQPDIIQLTSSTLTPSNSYLMTTVIAFSDCCDSFFKQLGHLFQNCWDTCFRTDGTAHLATLTLQNFLIWLKTKTN